MTTILGPIQHAYFPFYTLCNFFCKKRSLSECRDLRFWGTHGLPLLPVFMIPAGTRWNVRMVVETVLSMLTRICQFKHMGHRAWLYFETHLCYTLTLFNLLIELYGLQPDENGFVKLSIVDFDIL